MICLPVTGMRTLTLPTTLIALAALALTAPATAAPFWGIGKAIDGDSLTVDNKEVRLHGIDAPEFNQSCKKGGQDWACGSEAYDRLSRLVTGKEVRCTEIGKDQYGRTLGRCTVGALDVNRTMVTTGYAVAFRRYSMEYISAEESAKTSKRGIWAGTFEMPSDVRHAEEAVVAEPVAKAVEPSTGRMPVVVRPKGYRFTGGCTIKGNHSKKGELIYHLPGMPYYDATIPERMFCSEEAAKAAGFRKSRAQ
jgi:endonuclease YncB( thermonuclease family)